MKILFLSTGAFGFTGGIAEFERAFLSALCKIASVDEVEALPRNKNHEIGELPKKLRYRAELCHSKLKYLKACTEINISKNRPSLVICGHINLLPFALVASAFSRAPIVLITHGIEVWRPKGVITSSLLAKVSAQISVSDFTLRKMRTWAKRGPSQELTYILPNAIDMERFYPAPKRGDLIRKHGLEGKKVLLTVARLASGERYKGIDEVIGVLSSILAQDKSLVYLVVGKGDDKERLEAKAESLGLDNRVIFTGYVSEQDKPAYYNLADAFVMPSSGEGFGIVFLEALACGVPVIAGNADGAREALRGGELGSLVDPKDSKALVDAIQIALNSTPIGVPHGLEYFSRENYDRRVLETIESLTKALSLR